MNIGLAIRSARKKKGFTQGELCYRMRMSVNALSLIETDQTSPQQGTLDRICRECNVSFALLMISALEEEDFPVEKREAAIILTKALKEMLV